MKRNDFLKLGALAVSAPFFNSFLAKASGINKADSFIGTDDILQRLIAANDRQVTGLLQSTIEGKIVFARKIGYDFSALAAAYSSPASVYYHNSSLVSKLEILSSALLGQQSTDGTVNIGNLESPPDTAFLVEILSAGAFILIKDNSAELQKVNKEIKRFLVNAGNALATGGVHTPNHRWVICAALARLYALYPDKKYITRIEEWLGEGVFMDSDGHYPERSGLYADVENTSLITIARFANKPSLFQQVRKNLSMTYYYLEPNGDLVTADSRRQDQYIGASIFLYYINYRYMAIRDNNSEFAAITRLIEDMDGFEKSVLNRSLFHFLENDLLQKELPPVAALPANFEKLFTTSELVRIKRDKTTITLFGGVDWPLIIASGRSNSPNFFSYRKGNAILKYLRLSSGFFNMGYFYSDGVKKEGGKYILQKKLSVPYYQPIPKNKRNSKGDYKLSPSIDDRFWNKMDFENRPVSNVKNLITNISLVETNGTAELTISINGMAGVPVTIELCFLEGGTLTGTTEQGSGTNFLETGFGKYEYKGDTIQFGPGVVTHKVIANLEGERYSTHFGSLKTEGMHVYLTGTTPFQHKLTFS